MNTLINAQIATACEVRVTDDALALDLTDGRTISVPLAWYPRLLNGTRAERNKWRLIGDGLGIHWADLDEDISVEGIILGKHSCESQRSLKKWLEARATKHRQGSKARSPRSSHGLRRVARKGFDASKSR